MADFTAAYKAVMQIEGGYANDPDDRGGETYMGIARKHFPNWIGWGVIDGFKKGNWNAKTMNANLAKHTPLQLAVQSFYQENFWNRNRLGEITNQQIAQELFDTGVNMGVTVPGTFLQRALNVLNKRGSLYPDILVDGKIGSRTIQLTNNFKNPKLLYDVLNTMQGAKYIAIAEANPSQEKFMYGWLSRTYD